MILGVIIGLLLLSLLVIVHELGHAIVAHRNSVVVEEFGIGFPPRAWAKKLKNGVMFSINWLPIGGFVKLQGEHDSADKKGDYGKASYWQKTKILLAGVSCNLILAAILLTIISLFGLPKIINNQFYIESDATISYSPIEIVGVIEGSAADEYELEEGDIILGVDGNSITSVDELINVIGLKAGQELDIKYQRSGSTNDLTVNLPSAGDSLLGVNLAQGESIRSTWSAPVVGIVNTLQFTGETVKGLGRLLVDLGSGLVNQFSDSEDIRSQAKSDLDSVSGSIAGPIGILTVIVPSASQAGFMELVLLCAILSISLAVMNILPIPVLDGGRWLIMSFCKLFKCKLTKEREEKFQFVGFILVMLILIMVTLLDVGRIL